MIDELEILKTILENLSAVGIKGVLAYIVYKLAIASFWLGGLIYALKSILRFLIAYRKAEMDKKENDAYELKDVRDQNQKLRHEIEDVKHCYKILKEAKDVK